MLSDKGYMPSDYLEVLSSTQHADGCREDRLKTFVLGNPVAQGSYRKPGNLP